MDYMAKAARKYLKFAIILIFLLLLFILCANIFFRPINHYKPFFEKLASNAIHQPVTIGKIAADWHGLLPVLDLSDITIYDPIHHTQQLQAQHLQLTPNLLKSLTHWSLTPEKIYLSTTKLAIEQLPNDTWVINGIKIPSSSENPGHTIESILTWVNNHGEISLDHVDVTVKKIDGTQAELNNLKLLLTPSVNLASLDTGPIHINSQALFAQALDFDHLHIDLTWLKTPQGWQISAKHFLLTNADLQLHTTFKLDLNSENNGSPHLQLRADFSDKKIVNLHKYLPKGVLSEKLTAWLSTALVNGDGVHGTALINGPLQHFPFADHSGRFEAWVQTENIDLRYLPNWPELTHTFANLKFDSNSLQVDVSNAQVLGINTHAMHAEIPDLHDPVLKLHWASNASYSDLSRFVFASPLNHVLGETLRHFEYTGPTHLKIDLSIPIHNAKELKAMGSYVFMPAGTLAIPAYQIILNNVQGALQFTENSINAKDIKGQWLGQPTSINIATHPQNNKGIETEINITGGLSIPGAIKNYNLNFLSPLLTGITPYKANLRFAKINNKVHSTILVNSNLNGVTANLPEPLKKSPQEIIPTTVKLESSDKGANIFFNYGKKLSAALALQTHAQRSNLYSGDIELGGKPAKLPNTPGLVINARIPSLNLSELGQYFSPGSAAGKNAPKAAKSPGLMGINLKSVNLNFDQLSAFGITINKVFVQVKQSVNSWLININSADILGYILIPQDLSSDKPIKANFHHVYLTAPVVTAATKNVVTKEVVNKTKNINPQQIPPLDLIFNNVYYDNHALGRICFLTMRQKNAMQITRLSVDFPLFRFFAAGHWRNINGKDSTTLGGNIKTNNLGALLTGWELTKSLKDTKGSGEFALSWAGPVYQPDTKKLNGNFSFKFEKGEILNVLNNRAEAGLGKILNLLTIQSLQNLLLKPFGLLTPKTSFDFDKLTGDFTVIEGNAETKNTLIKGDLAKIETKGRIGLGAKDYDLSVKITPFLTGSFAGASAFIAGPIIGGAVWVANKLIGGILNSFFSTTYHVTGSWTKPSFEKVKN